MKIYLLRHARTRDNELGINGGRTDSPLSDAGWEEARALAPTLAQHRYDLIVVSPLRRTRETIEPYLETVSPRPPIIADERTIERDMGDLTGSFTGDGTVARHRAAQGTDKISWKPPHGESTREVAVRAKSFFEWLCAEQAPESVLVVGHQNFLRNLELIILGKPVEAYHDEPPALLKNGELREFDYPCTNQ